MTNSETELDELKALQREAAESRSARRQKKSTGSADSGKSTGDADSQTEAEPAAAAALLEEATPESATTLEDINIDFNAILKDMEDAAQERPVLALLAAFSLGIVVGQMFSRR